tara:strand:- start:13384 stop:14253 length:870 start_codon:yes stop_codon:yes gene_type:complete
MAQFNYIKEDCVEIYKGTNLKKNRNEKVLVFDLDETLGSFSDLDILWKTLQEIIETQNAIHIFDLLEIYPEFLRTNIIKILTFIYKKKKTNHFHKLYLYTNNQSPSQIVNYIVEYLTKKITKVDILFDQIIYAFKINNHVVQVGRTSHEKTHNDLINCTLLPEKTSICFIDNSNFNEMKKDKIYYIQPKPYFHRLSTYNILDRLFSSKLMPLLTPYKNQITDSFLIACINSKTYCKQNKRTEKFMLAQDKLSKRIMYHIKEFFLLTKKKESTKKVKKYINNFTRRKYKK